MTIWRHELKQGRNALLVWAAAISFMLGACVVIYPEMSSQMEDVNAMFGNMGGFSAAFGMDKINFGEFQGFFGVECGNVLGLGGAFFSALVGISALAKEERGHTAEFLLSHPVSRTRVIGEKLCAVVVQIALLNLAVLAVTVVAASAIGESVAAESFALLFLAYFLMQLEIAGITFGISAFLSRGGPGLGLGLAAVFYFVNIISNLTKKAAFLKYLTPFGYAEGADIVADGRIPVRYLSVGMAVAVARVVLAFYQYRRKDIA